MPGFPTPPSRAQNHDPPIPSPICSMFSVLTSFALLLCSAVPLVVAQSAGTISAPFANSTIGPGETFNFTYNIHADYGVSSYGFSVYLITEGPTSTSPSAQFMDGHFFGRYQLPNYPADPYPSNLPPSSLTMPNFSQPQGGFGEGETCSNCSFQLVVLEEWSGYGGSVGNHIGWAATPIIYNATTTN